VRIKRKVVEATLGLVVLGALVVGAAGCGSSDISAFSVGGHEVSQSDINDELKALRDNQVFRQLADRDAANGGLTVSEHPNTVTSALSSAWVTNIIQDQFVQQAIAKRGVKVTADDRAAALSQAKQDFGTAAAFNAFPKFFRDRLVARRARALALASDAGADLTTQEGVNALVDILVATAKHDHVTVDPRYGTWDQKRLEVVAPRPPGAPKVRTVNPNTGG
jgi:SurA-like protein